MLKAPLPGMVKTRLAAGVGNAQAVRIYRCLVEHQLRLLPFASQVYISYGPGTPEIEHFIRSWLEPLAPGATYLPQLDGCLGTRISAAVRQTFERGAVGVVVIGTDCPRIDSRVIRRVRVALWPEAFGESHSAHDLVMVPATDGGYCLLATKQYHPELFRNIDWSTERVCRQTLDAVERAGLSIKLLPEMEDVDDTHSWERALAHVPGLRESL
jgi:hypothetical protein